MSPVGKVASGRTKSSFDRRCHAAERGLHLPTVNELLRLSPFYNDDIESDIQTFAERMLLAIGKSPETRPLHDALSALSVAPWRELVDATISAFEEVPATILKPSRRADVMLRLKLYSAYYGNEGAISAIATLCFERSMESRNAPFKVDLLRAGIAWQYTFAMRRSGYNFGFLCSPRYQRSRADDACRTIGEYWQKATAPNLKSEDGVAAAPEPDGGAKASNNIGIVVVSAIGNMGWRTPRMPRMNSPHYSGHGFLSAI